MVRDSDIQITGIEVATNRQVAASETGNGLATDVAVTPDGRLVYVTDRTQHLISVVKTGAGAEPPTHPTHWTGTANGIAILPDGRTAYVTDARSKAVQIIPLEH